MPVAVASTVSSGPLATATMTSSDSRRTQTIGRTTTCPSPTFDARRLKNGELSYPVLRPGSIVRFHYLGSISSTFYTKLFLQADPKSIKKTVKLSIFFTLSGSTSIKALRKALVKLTPVLPFINQHFGMQAEPKQLFCIEQMFIRTNVFRTNVFRTNVFWTNLSIKCVSDKYFSEKYFSVRNRQISFRK